MRDNFKLKEKEIYELFNNIKLDENFYNAEEEISTIQKERIKRRLTKKIKFKKRLNKLKYTSIAASIAILCLVGTEMVCPAFAEDIPVLGSIIQTINYKFGNNGDYDKFSKLINKSITSKGITFTINEALIDNSKLILSYTIKSDKKINDLQEVDVSIKSLTINGKKICNQYGCKMGEYIDANTYTAVEEINTEIPKHNNLNIDLKIRNIVGNKGKWDFEFNVSRDKLKKKSFVVKPNKKVDLEDSIIKIDKVICSPINTSIFISGNYKSKNEVRHSIFNYDFWIAYDDKGVQLKSSSLSGASSTERFKGFKSEFYYEKLNAIPKNLTIVPCKINCDTDTWIGKDGKVKTWSDVKEVSKEITKDINKYCPIELKQGNFGSIIVNEIIKLKDKTRVKFIAKGKAPYYQAESIYIKDDKKERIGYKGYNIKRDKNKPNEFTIDFEALDDNKKYSICTTNLENTEFREDLKFKIYMTK